MILKIGDKIKFGDNAMQPVESIPAGNWLVKQDPQTGEYYLLQQEDFDIPDKVYGNVYEDVGRYLNTFENKNGNLGILLKGVKGTGKSLTAKCLCIASRLPVILITAPYRGPDFESFLSNIKQECIIFIDEFEKIYSARDRDGEGQEMQASLLTVLDGVFESKKLFLLTANDMHHINDALINRPGRIHYLRNYESLSDKVISDIIDDKLEDKAQKEDLLKLLYVIGEINIDMLVSLIKEMNMYKETAKQAVKFLNIEPANSPFDVTWSEEVENNLGVPELMEFEGQFYTHPLSVNQVNFYGNNSNASQQSKNVALILENCKVETGPKDIKIYHKDKEYIFKKQKVYKYSY